MILLLLMGNLLKKRKEKEKSATIAVSVLFRWHYNTQQAASGHSTLSQESPF